MSHSIATELLLSPASLEPTELVNLLGQSISQQIDFADIFLQTKTTEYWLLEDSMIKEGSYDHDRGFGLRMSAGDKTGFAYADTINLLALKDAAHSAKSIVDHGTARAIQVQPRPHSIKSRYTEIDPCSAVADQRKVEFLQQVDQYLRSKDPRVVEVMVSLAGEYDVMMVLDTQGQSQTDMRPLVSMRLSVYIEQAGRREQGAAGFGGRYHFEQLLDMKKVKFFADKALSQALTNLEAVDAPAGLMPVVLGPGWPGVLLHEAVGHGLEGDFNRKGSSVFAGKIGQQVAASCCTVVDDGTLQDRRGSLTVDDEGVESQRTVLIEKGILKGYMQDKHNARLMGVESTGNGRRELYNCLPMPRMTNTFMTNGDYHPEEILQSLDRGIYAVDFSGGQVDITSGQFVFSMSEAYLVEKGKIVCPVRGATLIGSGFDVMQQISMVGNDLKLDDGIGTCGKAGQSVPVGVGQPTLKIDQITVGGQK
ncbi:MAG: metalloprotease TldD [Gammaproteobacteria bacterium RIFCSPHIGHO2_12_FULL_41_15]|nr:MAG: metalloprotease TldD [Gammaproteobacteria bacterium RIFCSPHIGHO2_12_FULL_41_15]